MHTVKDFARQFGCSRNSMHTYLQELKPILKLTGGKRKRLYTDEEAALIIQHLKKNFPKLFKPKPKTLSQILKESETT